MAKDKKSFLLYVDLIHTVKKLPNDKAGELFKHILSYVNDENPETDDILINIAFEPIKQSLKRDLQKYENIVKRNSENGQKGGRPKAKKPTGLFGNPKEPKKADSDSDSDSVIDIKKKDINIPFDTFWELYDKRRGDKDKIEIKWKNLKDKDRRDIMEYIPKYIQSQPEKKFRKDPSTFLNNKSWNDELIVEDHSPAKINTKYNLPKNVRAATESEIRQCLGDEYTYRENVEKLGIEYIYLEKVKQCLMIRTDRDKPYFVYNSKIYEL